MKNQLFDRAKWEFIIDKFKNGRGFIFLKYLETGELKSISLDDEINKVRDACDQSEDMIWIIDTIINTEYKYVNHLIESGKLFLNIIQRDKKKKRILLNRTHQYLTYPKNQGTYYHIGLGELSKEEAHEKDWFLSYGSISLYKKLYSQRLRSLHWLAQIYERMRMGYSIKEYFINEGKKVKRRGGQMETDFNMVKKLLNKGKTIDQASLDVAEQRNKRFEAVRKNYYRIKNRIGGVT